MSNLIIAAKQSVEAMRFELKIDWTDPDESLLAADKLRDAIISLEKAIEQAEKQEPVAWMNAITKEIYWRNQINSDVPNVPLYTHPPKRDDTPAKAVEWVGLTDEEQNFIYQQMKSSVAGEPFWVRFADAVEAKLKEKNND